MATIEELISERARLAQAAAGLDTGAFPGTKARRAYTAALTALGAFDVAHPEVHREIMRRHDERVLGGEDPLDLAARL